jgi:pimeloyl-ACP methyl ester carboxylesterase
MEPRSLYLSGDQGLRLHALQWSTEGTAMVFLHGFGNSCRVWDPSAAALAPYYRVLALDHRGHGDSQHDAQLRYDLDTLTADLEAVLAQLSIERVVLVGHSLGGRVALRFAERNPTRLAGLVLVDIGPENDPRGVVRISQETETQDTVFESLGEYRALLGRQYPEGDRDTLARMAEHWTRRRPDGRYELKLDPAFFRGRAERSGPESAAREREEIARAWAALRKLSCPTLVVRGAASDILSQETADAMEEAIPDGRLEVIPRAAHSVMLDNPRAFEESLGRFALGE